MSKEKENSDCSSDHVKDESNESVSNYQRGLSLKQVEQLRHLTKHKYIISKWYSKENAKKWSEWMRMYCGLSDECYDKSCKNGSIVGAILYGKCVSEDRMEVLAKMITCIFIEDELTELDEKVGLEYWHCVCDLLDRLEGKDNVSMIKWPQYISVVYILLDSIWQKYSPNQVKRMVYTYKQFVLGWFGEFNFRKKDDCQLNIEEWYYVRCKSIKLLYLVQLIEYAQDIELTEEEWNNEDFQNMITTMIHQNIYVNELVSLKKELNVSGYDFNATFNGVVIIMNKQKITLEEAIDVALHLVRDDENKIEFYQKNLLGSPNCSSQLRTYIECFNVFIAGHFYASTYLDRFVNAYDESERIYSSDDKFILI